MAEAGEAAVGATTGSLFVESRPSSAQVFIDNRSIGTTPRLGARAVAGQPPRAAGAGGVHVLGDNGRGQGRRAHPRVGVAGAAVTSMNAVLALEDGTFFRGTSAGATGETQRRSGLQHEHDRLSGSADRSVLRRTDRDDDLGADRQLRRVGRGRRVGASAGRRLHHPRVVAGRQQLARRSHAHATTSRATASSPSPTSTRAR